MRFDSIGMFWEDEPSVKGKRVVTYTRPPVPETGWRPPTHFPDLSQAVVLSVDTETYDPELNESGPGWARGVGHIVGVSVAAQDRSGNVGAWYFPIRHEDEPEFNLDPAMVLEWLGKVLSNPKQPKIGANIVYDIGWLEQEGVYVKGPVYDVQYAEALLSEGDNVALEDIAQKYLGAGKESNLMYDWIQKYFHDTPKTKLRKWIYKTPPRLVGPYAESDADLPLRLMNVLWGKLDAENMLPVFNMECRLIPLMVRMRMRGVRVDVDKAERLRDELNLETKDLYAKVKVSTGVSIDATTSAQLAKVFDAVGVKYPFTEKGSPSFKKDFLEYLDHPIGQLIRDIREREKLVGTFIDSYILKNNVNGIVYGSFHQLRGTGGGTRSGRFSSSHPNLQNIPSRTELGKRIRELYLPDVGAVGWRKYDQSQVEYRMLLHYAVGHSADEIRAYFNAHPETDYHDLVIALIDSKTGRKLDRKPAKTINFGLIYGMGVPKLTRSLGLSPAEGKSLFAAYHEGVPFAKETMDHCSLEAGRLGYISTIMGRKSRFDMWESMERNSIPLPFEEAVMRYGTRIRRSMLHKALNRRLQGSAADIMKEGMLQCYEQGIYDVVGIPMLTVHDETDHSDMGGALVDEAFKEMKRIYETAIPLKIPLKVDYEFGSNWGNVKEVTN